MKLCLPPPSATQRQFFAERHRYVAFGGARGGGKSWAVRVKAVLLCERYPGIKVMIVRRTYPELRANYRVTMKDFEMLEAFTQSLKDSGFKQVTYKAGVHPKNLEFSVNDLDVYFPF